MKTDVISQDRWKGGFTAALMFEGAAGPLGIAAGTARKLMGVAAGEGFTGRLRRNIVLRTDRGSRRVLVAGLGRKADFETDRIRVAVAGLVRLAGSMGVAELGLPVPPAGTLPCGAARFAAAAVEGAALADYRYSEHRTDREQDPKSLDRLSLVFPRGRRPAPAVVRAVQDAGIIAEAVCYARDLVNEPPSQKSPEMMAELATWLARRGRIEVEVQRRADLVRLGMNGILRVGAGSHEPPCLVHFVYRPRRRSRRTVCVVGKGVTFDSGGLSLKPSASMDGMKSDMAGAAAVFGLFKLLGELDAPVTVHGLAPLAENLPGGGAQKPGDVIRHYNGKTVEVLNTDAEGRLILADALAYGSTLKPDIIIDMATLTGACVIALGDEYSALLGTDQAAIDRLIALGREQGEWFWQLPLPERYRDHLKSKVADLKNIGKPRIAGTIAAGLFLREFVGKGIPWVHIDIAGPAFTKEPRDYAPPGGTGVPLRTLAAFIRNP